MHKNAACVHSVTLDLPCSGNEMTDNYYVQRKQRSPFPSEQMNRSLGPAPRLDLIHYFWLKGMSDIPCEAYVHVE